MFTILYLTLITYQITTIICHSTFPLFRYLRSFSEHKNRWFRYLGELCSCFLCVSVWVGIILSYLLSYTGIDSIYIPSQILSGIFISALAWFVHIFENKVNYD